MFHLSGVLLGSSNVCRGTVHSDAPEAEQGAHEAEALFHLHGFDGFGQARSHDCNSFCERAASLVILQEDYVDYPEQPPWSSLLLHIQLAHRILG